MTPTLIERERREAPQRDRGLLHCFPWDPQAGEKALCGVVKVTRDMGHPNMQKCVVCLALDEGRSS